MNDLHSGYLSLRSTVMSDYEPTSPWETLPSDRESGKPSEPTALEGLQGGTAPSALPSLRSSNWPISETMAGQRSRPTMRGHLAHIKRGLIVVAALIGSVTGLVVGVGGSSSAGAAQSVASSGSPGHLGGGGQGSNARSGPAAGGSSGTVGNVAKSSFTLTTSAGQEVTIAEESSTKYDKGSSSTSKSAITNGEHVLVLGTVNSTTIKATQVIVQKTSGGSKPSTATAVVPFQKDAAETSKQVGQ